MNANLQMTLRWYGSGDKVQLWQVAQVPPMRGIVTSLYDIPPGEVWEISRLQDLKQQIEAAGLKFSVIESIPVHEEIKIGLPSRDQYIDAYCQSVRNMAAVGVLVLTYNFMPIFDWMRTDLNFALPDGSTCLNYVQEELEKIDLSRGTGDLPGWGSAYSAEELLRLKRMYEGVDEEALWKNLEYFLKAVVPVAEEVGVKMAIHPDDPPWGIFGLPRIITNEHNLKRLCSLVDSPNNGVCVCSGSLGADPNNNVPQIIRTLGERVHFVHARNVKTTAYRSFHETTHDDPTGNVSLKEVMQALYDIKFSGPVRPDHGRMIWGEEGRAGYGLYDRALGAMYIWGLWTAIAGE